MIIRIARKEFLDLTRDGRFRWSAGIVGALLLTSLAIGWRHHREVEAQHGQASAEVRESWVGQGEKNPHAAAHYGMFAFKPHLPLAFVDRGVDAYTGVSVFLEAHRRNEAQYRPARDATALQRFGELTAAMVLQALLPLVIIFLAFPAFAGEREQGTLRQVLSLGVRPRDLAIGKALGISAAIGLVVVPGVILGVIAMSLSEDGDLARGLPRMLPLMGCYLAYHALYLGLAIAVSARASTSRVALVALLAFWMADVLVVPRLAVDLARQLAPTPSSLEFSRLIAKDMEQGIDGHNPADQRLEKLKEELLAKYEVDDIEDLPVSFAGVSLQAGEDYGNKVFDRRHAELWDAFEDQEMVRRVAALVSPGLALRSLSMALSGTDVAHHRGFVDAAEEYRQSFIRALNEDIIENAADAGFSYTADDGLWQRIPPFDYAAPSWSEVLKGQSLALIGLAAWLGLATAAAWGSTRRLRID